MRKTSLLAQSEQKFMLGRCSGRASGDSHSKRGTPQAAGRIVSFDAAGGWNIEEEGYQSVGSGSLFAKSAIKKLYGQVQDADSALRVAIEALYDAADDDSATGGPDLVRGIYPTAVVLSADGAEEVSQEHIATLAREVIQSRSRADTFGPDAHAPRGTDS